MGTEQENREKKKIYLTGADLSTMGIAMVLCIVLGLAAGIFLDSRFDTGPIFTLIALFGGILAGFRIMYKAYMRFFSDDSPSGSNT